MEAVCGSCGEPFEASRASARYCSATCRSRKNRKPGSRTASSSGLVTSVRRDLEEAGRLDTFAGQLALSLAKQVSRSDATGVSSLSKELRQVMSEALAGAAPTPGAAESVPDEVDQMKERREAKARAAAGSA